MSEVTDQANGLAPPDAGGVDTVEGAPRTTDPSLDEYVRVAAFRSALRRFLRRSEKVARANGLTPQRYQLLLMVKGAPDRSERASVTELAQRLHLAQSTVTELIGRAEDAGLLSREPSPDDARVAYLRLTPEGERRLRQTLEGLEEEREALAEAVLGTRRSR